MLKKTVTYEDPFNPGEQVTEDLYFNLTKAELIEMEMQVDGGLKEHLEGIARAQKGSDIMREMKNIILKAYGKREGSTFVKSEKLRQEFEASEAYSTMFMEMVTEADTAVEFVKGIMPKGLADDNQEELPVDRPNLTAVSQDVGQEPRELTRTEAREMDAEELRSGLAEGRYILR